MGLFESIFTFLFKYRPALFDEGRLVWRPPVPAVVVLGLALVIAVLVAVTYRRAGGKSSRTDRLVLVTLRLAVVALLAFALLRPTLLLSSVVPQQNYLGILLDDSRSMSIPDAGGEARGQQAVAAFTDPQSQLLRALGEKFQLRYYRFSTQARRFEPGQPLAFDGGGTRMAPALATARADLGSLPLSGLVVVTDGADNAASGISETLLSLKASGVPVFTVGVGEDRFARDIELTRVTVPR